MIHRQTSLSANIVAFCRELRNHGFQIGTGEASDVLKGLSYLPSIESDENFRLTLRAILAKNVKEQSLFDKVFENYWRELERAVDSKIKEDESTKQKESSRKGKQQAPTLQELKDWLYGNKPTETAELAVYSPFENRGGKDLQSITEEGLEELMKLIRLLGKRLSRKKSRRFTSSSKGERIDFRRTFGRNIRKGGEIVELVHKKRKENLLKIVLVCDISKSMELYSKFLIQFMYGFQNSYRKIQTFVFSTKLQNISKLLEKSEFGDIAEDLQEEVSQWSGGTKIGESLHSLAFDLASNTIDSNTVVIILSDGWDTGEPEILEEAMRRIKKRSAYVIWLNPLAGNPEYKPETRGMAAALPFIDLFAAVHDVETFREVVRTRRE